MHIEKIQLSSIRLESLDAECVMAVSRCVRHLRHRQRVNLRLQDPDVLMQISKAVRSHSDAELDGMYQELKRKMVVSMTQTRSAERRQ